ncbi:hypothetical protein CLOSTMETH_01504 [[Clostridium] methylpentosum DSM 5476]|uniref:Uncharacterized protein n=1 Tax=[Clostridium] methylpentosum DSM 5476 TaxID=537013 RepID=C0ECD3_9FIRM|nr:hypothetical protein CLOSTMETH_01504 [[Clostridium] methylpentosum DSM 5476]
MQILIFKLLNPPEQQHFSESCSYSCFRFISCEIKRFVGFSAPKFWQLTELSTHSI